MNEELEKARGLLASGDIPGLLRHLRGHGEALTLDKVAWLIAQAAREAEFDDLAQAASAVADGGQGEDPRALYDFGYACIERGIDHLAIRPLMQALEMAPDATPVLSELVVALEHEGRHAQALTVLEEHEAAMEWLNRFQYVYNALMVGSLEKAHTGFAQLPEPEDASWRPAREKVRHMLARADVVVGATPLDLQDLRGWHYVLTGGLLTSLSPYGFSAGMTGRWAYISDAVESCAEALRRLRLILDAGGADLQAVTLLPDRSSLILGIAAAEIIGLPTQTFDPGKPAGHSLVVAYDLTETDPQAVTALRGRAPGQILFERATRWTDPPRVTADVSGLLAQSIVPPWGARLRQLEDGTVGPDPEDDRAVEVVAAEIVRAEPVADVGDGETPADPDEPLRHFVARVAQTDADAGARAGDGDGDGDGRWLGGGIREYVRNAGPVPSNRFL